MKLKQCSLSSASLATSYQGLAAGVWQQVTRLRCVTCHGSMKPRAVLVMATPCNHHRGDACLERKRKERR